jgi:23S rRNA pseudouridine2605 synthase
MQKAKSEKSPLAKKKVATKTKSPNPANISIRKENLHPVALPEDVRLNRFIAHAGICSRRKADELIQAGDIKVNDKIINEPGFRIQRSDKVFYKGERIFAEKKVYILINKPKDYLTTTEDDRDRKTVMDLIGKNNRDLRVYPVGRLDRNTTGLLLLTNDGDLAQQLSHPSGNIIKVYQAELNKPITKEHLQMIRDGITLEDGLAMVDEVDITRPQVDFRFVGIAIHIGKNRIVRRIFEHLGYDVVRLDRVSYAGLTKLDLPRGKWRYLSEKEIIFLKHLRDGGIKKKGKDKA